MPHTEEQLKRIQDKLQQLVQQHQLLQKENSKLKLEMQEERKHHQLNSLQVEQLQQQVEILKSSKTEMHGEEKKAFERRLSQYVKEIDKCITLLNE
jgi:chromosome segregation ATPase